MLGRYILVWTAIGFLAAPVQAEKPKVVVGQQQILMQSGQYNTFCFPDQPISILSERPLSVVMVCSEGTKLFVGRDWNSISHVEVVLKPSGGTGFDNGYAGIGGIYRDGQTIYGVYHAEDHVGKSSKVAEARGGYAAMFSVGLAVSQDGGKTFRKEGQILSSCHPYEQGKECGGLGDITVCADKSRTYLLAYYADFSRGQGKGIQICLARSPITDKAMPGTWKKYYDGAFSEPGLGGKESYVLSMNDVGGDAWSPHVIYSPQLDRYLLTFACTIREETDGVSYFRPKRSGIYIAASKDGLNWSEPTAAFVYSVLFLKGVPAVQHPTLHISGGTKSGIRGTLFYGYTPDFRQTPHHLAGRPVSISLVERDEEGTTKAGHKEAKSPQEGLSEGLVPAQTASVEVVIQAVKPDAKQITVAYKANVGEKSITLEVSQNAEITLNGEKADLESLKPGLKATVEYNKEMKIVTKIVGVGPSSVTSRRQGEMRTGTRSGSTQAMKTSVESLRQKAKASNVNASGEVIALDFSDVRLSDEDFSALGEIRSLRKLTLPKTGLSDSGVKHLSKLTQLSNLGMWKTNVTDEGLRHVGQLTNLSYLSLEANRRVTSDGLRHLTGLRRLSWLGLSYTGVSDEGMRDVVKLPSLTRLDLNHTAVTDRCLEEIVKIQTLKTLGLEGTKVTEAGAARLRRELPSCEVNR